MEAKTKRPAGKGAAQASMDDGQDRLEVAALIEYLADAAVSELVVVEVRKGTYQLEALITWKPRRSVLTATRGAVRQFRSVDTVVRLLRQLGVGRTSIRLELKT